MEEKKMKKNLIEKFKRKLKIDINEDLKNGDCGKKKRILKWIKIEKEGIDEILRKRKKSEE